MKYTVIETNHALMRQYGEGVAVHVLGIREGGINEFQSAYWLAYRSAEWRALAPGSRLGMLHPGNGSRLLFQFNVYMPSSTVPKEEIVVYTAELFCEDVAAHDTMLRALRDARRLSEGITSDEEDEAAFLADAVDQIRSLGSESA